jgi:outer membrane receptor protein involved in Fe transport
MKNFPKIRTLLAGGLFTLAIATLLLASSLPAFAQATTGTLRGTVTDPNGGVVSGATVTARNQGTGVTSPTTTSGEGLYVISNLPPGMYTITVEPTAGFSKKAVTDVNVPIGQTTDLSIALALGSPTETVTVTSTGEEIITRDQAQISTTFETRKIEDLPSNGAGGGLDTLALLAPGVVASRNSGVNTDGAGLSVNGNRGRSNNFQIDGSDNNDLSIGGPSLFVDNQSQVAEYQVITNNFSAQYGRNSGAVINIVTKSGGNEFHGDLFEYHQNWKHLSSLNNVQKRSGVKAPNQNIYNAFGGTAGGPIWLPKFGEGGKSIWKGKDRAFFFFSYQGIRNPTLVTVRGTQPAILNSEFGRLGSQFSGNNAVGAIINYSAFAAQQVGNIHPRTDQGAGVASAFNFGTLPTNCTTRVIAVGGTPPAACASVTYTAFLNPATGAPFLTGGPYDVFNLGGTATAPTLYQAAFPERDITEPFTSNEWSYRFTVKATSKDNVDFRHLKQVQLFANNGAGSNGFTYDVPATSKNLGGTWTRQFSNSLVNEFKATTQDLNVEFGGANSSYGVFAVPKPADLGNAIANIAFGGITGVRSATALQTIGPATNIPQGRLVKVYQFADTMSLSRGKHSLVFGAEFKHLVNKVPFLPLFNGAYNFATASALTRLTNNAPSAVSITAGEPVVTYTENDQYYFVQDDFKIRPNLTLNIGVRYEYTGQPINQLHDITLKRESGSSKAIFDPTLPIDIRTIPFVPPDKNNWAPRIGFAYTPHWGKKLFGEDATVIRGGFAIAYDPAFYNILLNLQNVAPFSAALALASTNALASTTTSPLPLPANPVGNNIQAIASASGVLPLGKLNPLYLTQTKVAPNFHSPYSEQFSLGIQRQVNRSNVFEVRYVGTQGVGLFQNVNDNFFTRPLVQGLDFGSGYTFPSFSNLLPAGTGFQVCTNDTTTPFVDESACNGRQKRQAGITVRDNGAHSTYHSMQSRYSGRFLKNALSLNASYTWSKTIDNASEIFAFADIGSANSQNPFDRGRAERSLSNLHRKHAFSASFIYDVPFFKEQRGPLGHLLGGWQINGVQVSTSGNPFTPFENTNGSYGLGNTYLTSGDRPFIGNPKAPRNSVAISGLDLTILSSLYPGAPTVAPSSTVFYNLTLRNQTGIWQTVSPNDVRYIINAPGSAKIFGTPFGSMPRNFERGPGINQLNMSVFKTTKVGERLKVQFQASAFNVLNHPQPGYGVNAAGYLPSITLENAGVKGTGFNDFGDISLARRVVQFGLRFIY